MSCSEARDQFRGVNEGLTRLWRCGAEDLDRLWKRKDAMTGRWSDVLRWWSVWEDWIIGIYQSLVAHDVVDCGESRVGLTFRGV